MGDRGHDETPIYENGIDVENEENRMTDGLVNNDYRIGFMRQHLVAVHQQNDEEGTLFPRLLLDLYR